MSTPPAHTGPATGPLASLAPGMRIPYGGDRYALVGEDLAEAFHEGDALYVVQETGALLHVPADVRHAVHDQVDAAVTAFRDMASVPPTDVARFFTDFATRLEGEWERIHEANEVDIERARTLGRSTTRLTLSRPALDDMARGLRGWAGRLEGGGGDPHHEVARLEHDGWSVRTVSAPLGVIAFVFEGRPNVLADAAGVLASGNTAVLRIGGDALGTATAIRDLALAPALSDAGLPGGAISIIPVRDRSAGWALFSDPRLALAVTRGSGRAVTELSAVARQAGIPVSAHGTGGAWLVADSSADAHRFSLAVRHSLDRKVCNTLNVAVVVADRAAELVPELLRAADAAAASRSGTARVHVESASRGWVAEDEFTRTIPVVRADGVHEEPRATPIPVDELGTEWEWEDTPEFSVVVVEDLDRAIELVNAHSPHFVASLISEDAGAQDRFRALVDAPFVGDGFTRWVDGQYALDQPELGLSNWERGRLLARGAVLTGGDLTTRRLFAHHEDPDQHR
ncbi:aldehyde dehydrogenase family protein [Actinomyces sp.]|uniref:aldehyde dehydrogenase family protein n=1 Tax=Actinomyces sp. TaxID=29317 RepID=UPI002898280D|nr:aldehyde dehydrogenase family protein [Actinomyces sp.]